MRWLVERIHVKDNETLQTVILYAEHETNEDVRKDNWRKKHTRELIKCVRE